MSTTSTTITTAGSLTEEDVTAIRALREPWIRSCLDRDWNALLDVCTLDIALLPPDQPIAEGPSSVREFLEAFPHMSTFSFDFTHIDGRDDVATGRGVFAFTAEVEGKDVSVTGKFIDVFRRIDHNTWRFRDVIWNADHPAETD